MPEGRREKTIENMRVREASGCSGCTEKIKEDIFVSTLACQRPNVTEGSDFQTLETMLGL